MKPGTDILAGILIAAALVAMTSSGWRLPLPRDAPMLVQLRPAQSHSIAYELLGSDGREPRETAAQDRRDAGRSESR